MTVRLKNFCDLVSREFELEQAIIHAYGLPAGGRAERHQLLIADIRSVIDASHDITEPLACARYVEDARDSIEGADRARELARKVTIYCREAARAGTHVEKVEQGK